MPVSVKRPTTHHAYLSTPVFRQSNDRIPWATRVIHLCLGDLAIQNSTRDVKDTEIVFRHLFSRVAGQVILAVSDCVAYPLERPL